MAKTVVDVMKPFLRFSLQFVADQAQFFLLIPYFVKVHKFPNPGGPQPYIALDPAPSNILFGALASAEETCEGILIAELSLFWRLIIVHPEAEEPLTWWKLNASRSLQFLFLHIKFWLFQGHRLKRSGFFALQVCLQVCIVAALVFG